MLRPRGARGWSLWLAPVVLVAVVGAAALGGGSASEASEPVPPASDGLLALADGASAAARAAAASPVAVAPLGGASAGPAGASAGAPARRSDWPAAIAAANPRPGAADGQRHDRFWLDEIPLAGVVGGPHGAGAAYEK